MRGRDVYANDQNIRTILLAIFIALVAALSDKISEDLRGYLKMGDEWVDYLKILVIFSIAFVIIKFSILRLLPFIRRRLYKVANYEGYWLSKVDNPNRPYSISKIYYEKLSASWRHGGFALNDKFSVVAQWKSRSLQFDSRTDRWFFCGQWHPIIRGRAREIRDHIVVHLVSSGVEDRMTSVIIDDVYMDNETGNPDIRGIVPLSAEIIRVTRNEMRQALECRRNRIEEVRYVDKAKLEDLFTRYGLVG